MLLLLSKAELSNTWTQQSAFLWLCPTLCLFPSARKPMLPSHPYQYNKCTNKKCKTSLLPVRLFLTRCTNRAHSQALSPRYGLAGVRQAVEIGVMGQVWETPPSVLSSVSADANHAGWDHGCFLGSHELSST